MRWSKAAVFAVVTIVTGCYYHWGPRATGTNFEWKTDLDGYYDRLARGFLSGHLYVPVDPDPRLLALKDPLDPNAGNDLPKLFDAVLYNSHYYLYHGAGPAVLLFVPWRLLTHHDLPEGYALFLFTFAAYLCLAGTAISWVRSAGVEIKPGVLALMLLAIGFCSSIPFLLNRVWVYEVAIGAGYFCVAAGFLALARRMPVISGLMFGLAVGCRPPLIIAGAVATVAAGVTMRRRSIRFLIPFAMCGMAIGLYNFERFGSFTEFGLKYQITGPYQGVVHISVQNLRPGLSYLLLAAPDFSNVFPWVLMKFPPPDIPRPPHYFVEPIVGALYLAPFLPLAVAALWIRGLRGLSCAAVVSATGILLFLALTGLSTQRYEVDFLPLLVLAAVVSFAVLAGRSNGAMRWILITAMTAAVTFGVVVNLAMGITGPYDELMRNKPARYIWIARLLSPIEQLRPQLNPAISVDITHIIRNAPDHLRENLLLVGRPQGQYELFIDHLNGKPVLVSRFAGNDVRRELDAADQPASFHIAGAQELSVAVNGSEILRQWVSGLVAAPSQVHP